MVSACQGLCYSSWPLSKKTQPSSPIYQARLSSGLETMHWFRTKYIFQWLSVFSMFAWFLHKIATIKYCKSYFKCVFSHSHSFLHTVFFFCFFFFSSRKILLFIRQKKSVIMKCLCLSSGPRMRWLEYRHFFFFSQRLKEQFLCSIHIICVHIFHSFHRTFLMPGYLWLCEGVCYDFFLFFRYCCQLCSTVAERWIMMQFIVS